MEVGEHLNKLFGHKETGESFRDLTQLQVGLASSWASLTANPSPYKVGLGSSCHIKCHCLVC